MKRWTGRHTVLAVAGVAVLVLLAGYAVVTSTRNADNIAVANEGETEVAVRRCSRTGDRRGRGESDGAGD